MGHNDSLVSVIIPVYKCEKVFNRCVDSVLTQSNSSFELLLTDDGSPDSSPQICDEYALEDERIIVIHKHNGGAAEARNYALECVSGDYIGFIDSDDYVDAKMYETMLESMQKNETDLCICGMEVVDEQDNHIASSSPFKSSIMSPKMVFSEYFNSNRGKYISPCNKLYKTGIFDGLRYPSGKKFEDDFVFHLIVSRCRNISFINNDFYKYVENPKSVTHNQCGNDLLDCSQAHLTRAAFFCKNNMNKFACLSTNDGVAALIDAYLYNDYTLNENYASDLRKQISGMPIHLTIKDVGFSVWVRVLMAKRCFNLLLFCYRLKNKIKRKSY